MKTKTLREQITQIAERWIGREYVEHVGKGHYPRMVNDCILHAFDHNMDIFNAPIETRALHRARGLMSLCSWREDEPAIE